MTVGIFKTVWTGGPSSPGYSIMCVDASGAVDVDAAIAAVNNFWISRKPAIPDEYTLRVDPTLELYDEETGTLTGFLVASSAPAGIPCTGGAGWAPGVGLRIAWSTAAVRFGRRVAGSTYLVPFDINAFLADGSVNDATQTAVETDCANLIANLASAGAPLVVWSRPSLSKPVGGISTVVQGRVPDKPAVLRGRRDP